MKVDSVSIIVITYNSEKYIKETLQSILEQDYPLYSLEIIISDDCSLDRTEEISKKWINKNKALFKNTLYTKLPYNSGIVKNYNHSLRLANSKWVKYIAGDDILKKDCISTFVKVANSTKDRFLFCGTTPFNEKKFFSDRLLPEKWFKGSAICQEKLLVKKGTIIEGPTLFLDRNTLIKLGGFEEKYPFIEDYPLYMKYLSHGYRLHYINKSLIKYREHFDSVSRSDSRFSSSILNAIDDYALTAAKKNKMVLYWYHYWINKNIRKKLYNSKLLYFFRIFDLINWKHKLRIYFQKNDL